MLMLSHFNLEIIRTRMILIFVKIKTFPKYSNMLNNLCFIFAIQFFFEHLMHLNKLVLLHNVDT